MHSIKNLIREYFKDTLYEAEIVMKSSRDKKLTIVTDNLRGVCGITVCTVLGPSEPISDAVEKTYLKVKFFQMEATLERQIKKMAVDARKIDGIISFIPYSAKKVVSRIYRN